jgi:LacI family transcriptional regulator
VERESTTGLESDNPDVAQAITLMRQSLDKAIDIDRIAARIGISRRLLELRFRRELDSSPARELLRLRIEKAQRLLLGSSLDMKSIAAACGFTHASHFQLVFRKQSGLPPGAWRQQNRPKPQREQSLGKKTVKKVPAQRQHHRDLGEIE